MAQGSKVRLFALISSMHEVSVTFDFELSIPSNFFPAVLPLPRRDVLTQCRWGPRTNPTPTQSQQDKLQILFGFSIFECVEIGQYFMTKDIEFSQFRAVFCRQCTLPREEGVSEPKGWIQGTTKIGPVLEVANRKLLAWSAWSITHGLRIKIILTLGSEFLMDQTSLKMNLNNNNEQKIPKVQLEEYVFKLGKRFCMPIKSKTTKKKTVRHQEQFLLGKEFGPMLNQGNGIDTGSSKFEQQMDRQCSAGGSHAIDLSVPRHAQYIHKAWKRHQNPMFWVDWSHKREVCMSSRHPPKISLKHNWKRELGSEDAHRPEVGQLPRSF